MIVTPIKTPIVTLDTDLMDYLLHQVPKLTERSVLVITSKIISICQHEVVKIDSSIDKNTLIHKEAEWYLPHEAMPRYGFILTRKYKVLIANAGIDESNGDGYYIFYPKDPFGTAAKIWTFLRDTYKVSHIGVLITDSHTTILRWGVTGFALSWCGFQALNSYVNQPDIFGRKFQSVQTSVIDSLACAAAFTMGEGDEQTPLAVISDIPNVQFQDRPPTNNEIKSLEISLEDDLYAPLLTSVTWQKGGA